MFRGYHKIEGAEYRSTIRHRKNELKIQPIFLILAHMPNTPESQIHTDLFAQVFVLDKKPRVAIVT